MGYRVCAAIAAFIYVSNPVNQTMPTNPIPDVGPRLDLSWKAGLEFIGRYSIKNGGMVQVQRKRDQGKWNQKRTLSFVAFVHSRKTTWFLP